MSFRTMTSFAAGVAVATLVALLRRGVAVDAAPAAVAADEDPLPSVVVDVDFDGMPFDKALEELSSKANLYPILDRRALEAAGLDVAQPIQLQMRRVPFGVALWALLKEGGRQTCLDYVLRGGTMTVSTSEHFSQTLAVRVYDVHDLIDANRIGPRRAGDIDARRRDADPGRIAEKCRRRLGNSDPKDGQARHVAW